MPIKFSTLALAAALGLGLAPAAHAAPRPSAQLVTCDSGTCLLVKGHRSDPTETVSINGHAVTVAGAHTWRARVPVETLRGWSQPYARNITVSIADNTSEVHLPIGLLGHSANLALITISRK